MFDNFSIDIGADILRSIIDSLAVGIYVLNRELQIQWVNIRAFRWLHKTDFSQLKGRHCYKEILGREQPCDGCPVLRVFETGRTERLETTIQYEGETRHYLLTATPLRRGRTKDFSFVIEMAQDISTRKKAEEKLRRLNDFNRAIIDNAPIAIFTIDKEGRFTSVNPALAAISGLGPKVKEKLLGFNWLKNQYTIDCGLAKWIKKGLQGERFELRDFPFITYRGDKKIFIDFKGVPLKAKSGEVEGLLCIIEETTDRVRTKRQLIHEAKMSAIGRLATGIAHELNNPLATIAAHSELAVEFLQLFDNTSSNGGRLEEIREYLEVIQQQAFRCKKIIKNLLDLTRRDGFEVKEIDLKELLDDLLVLVNFEKLKIRLVREIDENLPSVKADFSALRQALLNVISNAIDAVEGKSGATIWIRAKAVNNSHVHVEIEDNGIGIPEDVIEKIFEPFFTTKGPRKGIGLGLTLSYELLNKMGGNIEVESTPGKGSSFRIILPV